MKLLTLRLDDYRVLRQLTVQFVDPQNRPNADYTLSFLVGVNGSGKSTLLRALVEILRELYVRQDQPIAFPFRLEYVLGVGNEEQNIVIVNESGDSTPRVFVNNETNPRKFSRSQHLPRRIVVFTTGNEREWEEQETRRATEQEETLAEALRDIEADSLQLAIQELSGMLLQPVHDEGSDSEFAQSENPFLFIRSKYLSLITLCGLLTHLTSSERLLDDVLKQAQIKTVRGFSLRFRMNGATDKADRDYVEQLGRIATRFLRMGTDYLLMFDFTTISVGRILERAKGELQDVQESVRGLRFFERLVRFFDPPGNAVPILRDVNIFFERKTGDQEDKATSPILLFNWLSDGEQSFLGRMCLFALLGDTESLILLDEPEVHFNDYWKRQIVYIIAKVMRGKASHAIVTTHSSITLTDAKSESIIILNRDATFTSETFKPLMRTYAADPSDIIVNIFEAPVASGAESVDTIRRALRNARSDEQRKDQMQELRDLLTQVGPGYWSYQLRRKLALLERESKGSDS
jgi:ABC-type cobalamin/Fe3+-siderophores transport system ATPase subunit